MHTEEIAQGLLSDPHCNYNKLPAPPQQKHSENNKSHLKKYKTFQHLKH